MKTGTYIMWNGFLMFVGISGLFLIFQGIGLGQVNELRFLNIIVVAYFSNRMAKHFMKETKDPNFISSMFSIFMANLLAVILTVLGFMLYVFGINPSFYENLEAWILLAGNDLSRMEAAVGIFLEGMAGSVIISFVVMQYWAYVKPEAREIKPVKKVSKLKKVS